MGSDGRQAANAGLLTAGLLTAAGWWLLADASAWFAMGLPRTTAAVRAGRRRAVSRRVAVHFVPLLLTAPLAPHVGGLT